jgi:glycosyltransferase involved in cell wall biosynthesis
MSEISVIIPCFRNAKTICRALKSIVDQTRTVDEVIVVDDCSPEGEEIECVVREFPGVVYVRNQSNVGPAESRNIGIEKSRCEIVSFLDADDMLHPQKIEFQAEVLRKGKAVSCANRRIGPKTGAVSVEKYLSIGKVREFRGGTSIIYRNRLTGASLMAYKKDLKAVGGYDASLRSGEDYDLWLRLLDAGLSVLHIALPLYLYRQNEGGLSRDTASVSRWEMEMIKKALARRNAIPPFRGEAAAIWSFWTLKHILRNFSARSKDLEAQIDRDLSALAHPSFQRTVMGGLRVLLNLRT